MNASNRVRSFLTNRSARLLALLLACLVILVSTVGAAAQDAAPAVNGDYKFYLPVIFSPPAWQTEKVEASVTFGDLSNRALAINAQGTPCVVYGDDSLYYRCLINGEWVRTQVDEHPGAGRWATLLFDANNRAVIAYYDEVLGVLKVARQTSNGFFIDIVDTGGVMLSGVEWLATQASMPGKHGVGGRPSLAIDSSGRLHVSYYDFINQDLKYATFVNNVWQIEVVDSANAGEYNSLGVNAAGSVVYIAYYDGANQDAKLATRSGGAWSTRTLYASGQVGEWISLAVAKDGSPRAAFYSLPGHQLLYWNGTGVSQAAADISDARDLGRYASLALDKNDKPWISYYNNTSDDIELAHLEGSYWAHETVDFFEDAGTYTSIAITSSGMPLMVYYHPTFHELRFARANYNTNQQRWEFNVMVIDTSNVIGMAPEIDLTSDNRVAVAYLNRNRGRIAYTEWTANGWYQRTAGPVESMDTRFSMDVGAGDRPFIVYRYPGEEGQYDLRLVFREGPIEWRTLILDTGANLGDYPSVKAGNTYDPHVSYYDAWAGDLRYLFLNGGNIQRTTVDSAGNVGQYTSLALDSSGRPWISYYDVTNGDLKLARFTGAAWAIQTVDSGGDVGAGTWLVLDKNNNPRIAYYDVTNQRIKFAQWNGSAWAIEVIDAGVSTGSDAGLSLDPDGNAVISYYDKANMQLKYAAQSGGGWMIDVIDTAGDVGRTSALIIGTDRRGHAAYFDATNGDLKYALKTK